jgi:hypothetical protein
MEDQKTKTVIAIKRKKDMESELDLVNSNISLVKGKMREMNIWHPY